MSYPGGSGGQGIPPDIARMLKAQQDERAALLDQMEAAEIAHRQQLLDMAWLVCTCRRWFSWEATGTPPQSECAVHGNVMVTRSGRVL